MAQDEYASSLKRMQKHIVLSKQVLSEEGLGKIIEKTRGFLTWSGIKIPEKDAQGNYLYVLSCLELTSETRQELQKTLSTPSSSVIITPDFVYGAISDSHKNLSGLDAMVTGEKA